MSTDPLPKAQARLTAPGFGIALLVGVLYLLPFSLLLPADHGRDSVALVTADAAAVVDGGRGAARGALDDPLPSSFRLSSAAPCPKPRSGAGTALVASP
jgi:hypothetical protein